MPREAGLTDTTPKAIMLLKTGIRGVELANESGKRYFCKVCGSEFIVTTAGDGTMSCHGEPVQKK
jgi:hypothetical protein